ncbi:MAG TPA: AAA-like domain-containing protein [Candidatus Babeliales bacterium]|nr:AAA-like domain-containing protein [Candidatus Babeliales bacterium]
MRFFNTAGPIDPRKHYYIPHRLNEVEFRHLIEQEKYFILHAPRQSGKTTAIQMFVNELNVEGTYKVLYINVEPAQIARDNVEKGMRIILEELREWATILLKSGDPLFEFVQEELKDVSGSSLKKVLQAWCIASDKPILVFIDEIDSLIGDTLISVLRQLRAGYPNRPIAFPQSVCLLGVRDVRDYRIWSEAEHNMVLGGSAFNIKAESLTLPDFSLKQTRMLYLQHSDETGQQFTDEAIEHAYYLTQGQPWLVNALAYQACFEDVIDRTIPITKNVIDHAKETLIKRCDTHIDQLVHKLEEPRVRYIIDAIIGAQSDLKIFPFDDVQYVRDLGLIKLHSFDIANPIYQEIIPRALTQTTQERIRESALFYQNLDRSLNMQKLLTKFTEFYRENSATWLADFQYKESGPHLLLMAFLQRVINDGGTLHREYALDRKRVDLLLHWHDQKIVIELKVKRSSKTLTEGLQQTAEYMDISNATEGHLVVFDGNLEKTWDEKIYHRIEHVGSKTIYVWGL